MIMKKKITATILTAVLVLAFCLPAYAQEVTDPKKVYKEDAFNIDEAKLIEDFHKGEVWRCNNYLEYLDGVIFNLNETARIKKEVVTNYMYLAQYNGYYATLPRLRRGFDSHHLLHRKNLSNFLKIFHIYY